jgi:hypothetical protein
LGLQHVAKLEKQGFGMPAEFLAENQVALSARASSALKAIQRRVGSAVTVQRWADYAGRNINALWATIVLGEWLEAKN